MRLPRIKLNKTWQIGYANGWYVWDGKGNLSEGCSTPIVAITEAANFLQFELSRSLKNANSEMPSNEIKSDAVSE